MPALLSVVAALVQMPVQALTVALFLPLLATIGIGQARAPFWWPAGPGLFSLLGAFLLLSLLGISIGSVQTVASSHVGQQVTGLARHRLHQRIATVEWSWWQQADRARIGQALGLQAERCGVAVQTVLQLGSRIVILAVFLGWAMAVSLPLTLLVITAGGVVAVLPSRRHGKVRSQGERLTTQLQEMQRSQDAWLQGAKTLRFTPPVPLVSDDVRRLRQRADRDRALTGVWFDAGSLAVLVMAVGVGAGPMDLSGPALLLLLFLYGRIMPLASFLVVRSQFLVHAWPAVDDHERLITDMDAHQEPKAPEHPPLTEGIVLREVLVDHGDIAVGPVSLSIAKGECVALRAPSGFGKTTILDVIAGIQQAEGAVLVDGKPMQKQSWRSRVAYVPQEPFLLDGTIDENAAWMGADADEWLDRLCPGIDRARPIGTRGDRLSGGQRRRVAIALAMARRPDLLVLDEPTAELDDDSSRRVLQAIEEVGRHTTVILATHGPAPTVARTIDLDRVVVMHERSVEDP